MKQKRKRHAQQWPWSAKRFDYIVDAPISDVMHIIRLQNERGDGWFANRKKLRVETEAYKFGQAYKIKFHRDMGRNLNIELIAVVESLSEDSTRICGETRVGPSTLAIMGLLFCTHVLGVGFIGGILGRSPFMLTFGCFSVLIFVGFFAALTSGINKMIQELEEVIYKAEYGNDQQWIQKKKHPSYDSMDNFQLKRGGKSHAV
ncbi:MAG: hypothetical protein CL607_19075 [Anaerolineaceae bacterium]|nr:hypothetical protein [Anaerolineaceae bacterium]